MATPIASNRLKKTAEFFEYRPRVASLRTFSRLTTTYLLALQDKLIEIEKEPIEPLVSQHNDGSRILKEYRVSNQLPLLYIVIQARIIIT
jgi:hypothetical protein